MNNASSTTPSLAVGSPVRANQAQPALRIEKTGYRDWAEAYRCTMGDVELTVVASVGPRILSLRFSGGENLLHEDVADLRVGEWRLYGGHRFTTAPESPASYVPDNAPCRVTEEDGGLSIVQPNAPNGLEKALRVKAGPGGSGFELAHVLRNTGRQPWRGAPWAITGFGATGRVVVPWGSGTDQWRTQMVRYLVHAGSPYADATSRQWQPAADHFVIQPAGQRGKISLYTDRGWLALLRSDGTFVKHCPAIAPENDCLNGGCNAEVYVGPDYVELETLGPLTTLAPGQEVRHVERWHLLHETFQPEAWASIESHFAHD
ncbi:MAG: hypothetical protein FJ029_00250 [Actinobacteria bacterium]|nr:hypothetical protein [Actinomycetota bacterium]